MIVHCNRKVSAEVILYLYDNENFKQRKLYVAICPECGKDLSLLVQTRRIDGQRFKTLYTKEQARKAYEKYLQETDYKSTDVIKSKGQTYGLCYGSYSEIKDKSGKIVKIKEKAKDFYGTTKTLKTMVN